ncbi:MAG: hypothetical protein U1F67_26230 [Rubrivivax sp.]
MIGRLVIAFALAVAGVVAGVRAHDLYANVPVTWINGRGIPLQHIEGYERAFEAARADLPDLARSMTDGIGKRRRTVTLLTLACIGCLAAAGFAVHSGLKARAKYEKAT